MSLTVTFLKNTTFFLYSWWNTVLFQRWMVAAGANFLNNFIGKKYGSMKFQQRPSQLCGLECSLGQNSRRALSGWDWGICSNYWKEVLHFPCCKYLKPQLFCLSWSCLSKLIITWPYNTSHNIFNLLMMTSKFYLFGL